LRFDTSQGIEDQNRMMGLNKKKNENQTTSVPVNVWKFPERRKMFYNMVFIK